MQVGSFHQGIREIRVIVMKKLNTVIVGAGGTASYLLPLLLKVFGINNLTIYDQDKLEERNLDRQLFSPDMVGVNKAEALAATVNAAKHVDNLHIRPMWFRPGQQVPEDTDYVISCVDNHPSRRSILEAVDNLPDKDPLTERFPLAVLAGNMYFASEAMAYNGSWKDSHLDPRVRYPDIATSGENDPVSCQGEEQEAAPQLAFANAQAANQVVHLMFLWEDFFAQEDENKRGLIGETPIHLTNDRYFSENHKSEIAL